MSEENFQAGDKVRANGVEATLVSYDTLNDRLQYVTVDPKGGENRFSDHISMVRLEKVEAPAEPVQEELPFEEEQPAKAKAK